MCVLELYCTKMGRPSLEISNKRFGNITALIRSGISTKRESVWKCQCDCGLIIHIKATDLQRGRVNFCKDCNQAKSLLSPVKCIYASYKLQAEKRGFSFDISIEDFLRLIQQSCVYCGTPPIQYYKKKDAKEGLYYNGLDRQDNNIGYLLYNVVPCCKFCNFAKKTHSLSEFEDWIERLVLFRTNKNTKT